MADESWLDRITSTPGVHGGDPCIRSTRVPVSVIVGSVADGDTIQEIVQAYPVLTPQDVQAALRYAAEAVRGTRHLPMAG